MSADSAWRLFSHVIRLQGAQRLQTDNKRGCQDDQAGLRSEMMAVEEEEGEGEVAALLHNYLNMVEVRDKISLVVVVKRQ